MQAQGEGLTVEQVQPIVEALLFAAGDPLSVDRLATVIEDVHRTTVRDALGRIREKTERHDSGMQLGYGLELREKTKQDQRIGGHERHHLLKPFLVVLER